MFKNKKRLNQIEEEKQQLEKLKQQIEIEKQELLFIKEQLENSTPKINISNVYVWQEKELYSIVKLTIQNIQGRNWEGMGEEVNGYESTLIDIFTNNIIYQKNSTKTIQRKQYISGNNFEDAYFAILLPITEVERNLLAYTDKKVPLYVLQQLYYKLNNIDTNAYTLKKQK